MSKILCVPDVHGRKFWRKAIEKADEIDKVIFLGDYLDPYPDEIAINPDSMECKSFDDSENLLKMLEDIVLLKKSNPDKYILLTGNHTDNYIWTDFNAATRIDHKNYLKYHEFFLENLDLFNLVWIEDDVVFSHAGIVQGWTERVWEKLKFPENESPTIKEIAEVLQNTPLKNFTNDYITVIGDISHYRWGDQFWGSSEWADLQEHVNLKESGPNNIVPKGDSSIYQVFGHTQLKAPLITDKWACLDCRKSFIIEGREINEC